MRQKGDEMKMFISIQVIKLYKHKNQRDHVLPFFQERVCVCYNLHNPNPLPRDPLMLQEQ